MAFTADTLSLDPPINHRLIDAFLHAFVHAFVYIYVYIYIYRYLDAKHLKKRGARVELVDRVPFVGTKKSEASRSNAARGSMPIGSRRWGGEQKKMVEEARRNERILGRTRESGVERRGEERLGKVRRGEVRAR